MDPREASWAVRYLTTGTYAPGMSGGEKRKMRRMRTMFFYQETDGDLEDRGRLYFRPKSSDVATTTPDDCQKVLINNGHDPSPLTVIDRAHKNLDDGSHLTTEQTFKRVSSEWWWPRYLDEIRDYVRHCARCTNGNGPNNMVSTANISTPPPPSTSTTKMKKSHGLNSGLPTMVLPMKNAYPTETDNSPDRRRDQREEVEDVYLDGMSSSGCLIEKIADENAEEETTTNPNRRGGFVEKDEHGGVTIVIPSEPPPPLSIVGDSYDEHDSVERTIKNETCMDEVGLPKSTLCAECGSVIRNAGNLAVHMRRHLQYRPYHCTVCDYRGYDPDDVKRHFARVHQGNVSTTTKLIYKPKSDMESQLRELIASSKTIGGNNQQEQQQLQEDREDRSDNRTPIAESKMDTTDRQQLQAVIMSNLALYAAAFPQSPFGVNSSSSSTVPKEINLPTPDDVNSPILLCNLCNSSVPNSPVPLLRHLKSHFAFDGYLCPYCLMISQANAQQQQQQQNQNQNGNLQNMSYRTLRDFEMHLQSSVHKTHPTVAKLQLTLDRSRRLMCDQMTHFAEHAYSDAKIKCQLCSRKIAWRRQSLSDHLREHQGYYPYKCSTCRTPFVDLPALIEHVQSEQHGDQESNANDHSAAVIRYCPDVKAEGDAYASFPKCFPVLTSEYIENLEPDQSSSSIFATSISKRRSPTKYAASNFNLQPPPSSMLAENSASQSIGIDRSISNNNSNNRSTLRCQLCQAQISRNMSCLIAHAKVHLAYKPLKCDHCNFRHFAMSKIRRHNARVHGSKPVKVSYHPVHDIGRQIKEMKWQCFGAYGGGGGVGAGVGGQSPSSTQNVPVNQLDDPSLLEDEELRALHEQELKSMASINIGDQQQKEEQKSFHVSDILKEMIAVTNNQSIINISSIDRSSTASTTSSAVSSLSSLLAERMAAYEHSIPAAAQNTIRQQQQSSKDHNIDQPIGNGLGKKLCLLCNAYIANNPSSFENHACKHLDYKPYSCHYCQYQSYIRGKVTRHIQQVHSGEQVKISHHPIDGIRDRIQAVKLACFPFLASLVTVDEIFPNPTTKIQSKSQSTTIVDQSIDQSGEKKESIICQLCKSNLQNEIDLLETHMIETHMPSKLYCCLSCTYRTPQLWKAKQHASGAHAPDLSKYVTCPSIEDDETDGFKALQLLRYKCYGSHQSIIDNRSINGKLSILFAASNRADFDQSPLPVEQFKEDEDDEDDDDDDEFADDDFETDRSMEKKENIDRCRLCSETVENRLEKKIDHVKRSHLQQLSIFQCSICSYRSNQSESQVKQHISNEHKNAPLKVVQIQIQDDKEQRAYLKICFPDSGIDSENNRLDQQSNFLASIIAAANQQQNSAGGDSDSQSIFNFQNQLQQQQIENNSNQASIDRIDRSGNIGGGGNGNGGMLRKLICKLCNSTIADNPKSVGIHVKNHLNYKPYRCPFCRYMSCEQSKARRHIEHVHNANGDAIEIHAQENIKEKITEMKSRCFPNLGHMTLSDVYSNGDDAATTGSCSPEEYPPTNNSNSNGNGSISIASPTAPLPPQPPLLWNAGGGVGSQSTTTQSSSSIFPNLSKSTPKLSNFPQLQQPIDNLLMANRFVGYQCRVCKSANIRLEDMNTHAQTHLATGVVQQQQQQYGNAKWNQNKPYQCSYCGVRFGTDDKVSSHMANVHPTFPPKFVYQPEYMADPEQLLAMKKRCFPELFVNYLNELLIQSTGGGGNVGGAASMDNMAAIAAMSGFLAAKSAAAFPTSDDDRSIKKESRNQEIIDNRKIGFQNSNSPSPTKSSSALTTSKLSTPIDGRLTCQICEQAVSMNPNSLDVHVKNHLDFKPHSCAYCDYKSCIAGKVKRHLDNVHKGRQAKVDSFTKTSNSLKQIIADMRTACFPTMEGDYRLKNNFELSMTVENLRTQLKQELSILQYSGFDHSDHQEQIATNDGGNSNYNLEIRTDDLSVDRNSRTTIFSPPTSRTGRDVLSPRETEGNGNNSVLDTSLDEDLLSNCGTDTLSESGIGGGANGNAQAVLSNSGGGGGSSLGAYGKLPCMLCGALVADNPSSLGLHVRNHLDYKPFHCLLCDYKSCIQAKVKRHLRNVHKCPTDEMTYNPVANIRSQVTEMKIQCFPREAELSSIGRVSSSSIIRDQSDRSNQNASTTAAGLNTSWGVESGSLLLEAEDDDGDDENEEEASLNRSASDRLISNFYDRVMIETSSSNDRQQRQWPSSNGNESTTRNNDLEQLATVFSGLVDDDEHDSSIRSFVDCQICAERVNGDALSKTKHLTRHLGDYEYRCQYCDYTSFVQAETMKHSTMQHPKLALRVSRSTASGDKMTTAYERLSEQCFPANGSGGGVATKQRPKASIVCALCDLSIIGDSVDTRLSHATDHLNRSHYKCSQCSFMHVDDGHVKEHGRRDHSEIDSVAVVEDVNDTRTGDEFVLLCFPNPASATTAVFGNGESAANESDGVDFEDEIDGDEDEDEFDGEENRKDKQAELGGARLMADGPRYICQLCKSPVSMYASSLYVHVKNHMNYKPYSCTRCEYKSPVKSKVRRHIQNAHKGQPGAAATICYTPIVGVEQEVSNWKKRCFPELTSTAALTNDKVPCRLCQTDVADTLLSKSVHAKNHLDAKPYYCPYCSYKSCLRGETRRHLVRQHPGNSIDVVYHSEDVAKQDDVDAMIAKCFVGEVETEQQPQSQLPKEESKMDTAIEEESTPAVIEAAASGGAKRKIGSGGGGGPAAKKEKKAESKEEHESQPQRCSYNLRTTRSSTSTSTSGSKINEKTTKKTVVESENETVKLGPAYRDWYCCYCTYKAHSKYVVKQHCLTEHPGQQVDVSEISRVT